MNVNRRKCDLETSCRCLLWKYPPCMRCSQNKSAPKPCYGSKLLSYYRPRKEVETGSVQHLGEAKEIEKMLDEEIEKLHDDDEHTVGP